MASSESETKPSNHLEDRIAQYITEKKPHLYILTPCYGGMCHLNYLTCILDTRKAFDRLGFPLTIEFCKNDSLVSRARNNLIARAMNDPKATHFLFIDSDITWNYVDILRLVLDDKALVGGIYPLKKYNWDKLKPPTQPDQPSNIQTWLERKNTGPLKTFLDDESMIQTNLLNYNLNHIHNQISIENGLIKVKHIATGFMMIQRPTLEKMMTAFPSTKYTDDVQFLRPEENVYAFALFDCGVEEGHYMSEDWLFCNRWRKMGGDVFVDIQISLTHSGIEDYRGCFFASLPLVFNSSG